MNWRRQGDLYEPFSWETKNKFMKIIYVKRLHKILFKAAEKLLDDIKKFGTWLCHGNITPKVEAIYYHV